ETKDAAAVSNIMRSVQEELIDEKRELEISSERYQMRLANVSKDMQSLVRICSRLFVSIRRPTREQREMMRDIKIEIAAIMNDLEKD
ncbi:MAG: hypothetical protein AB1546_08580, partial [bacterium]